MLTGKDVHERKAGHSYALTLLFVALCAFAQFEGRAMFGQRAPLGLMYLPVMASAILGGWRAALLASASALLLSPLLVAPHFTFIVARPEDSGAILELALVCLFTCAMAAVLERSRRQARAYLLDLQGREHTLRALLGASVHAIVGIGPDGRIQFASDSVARLCDFAPGELIGQSYEVLVVSGLRQLRGGGLDNLFHGGATGPIGDIQEIGCRRKDGSLFPAEASLAITDVPGGRLVVSYIADISERREAERRILHAARHDPLTGLPNRALVYELGAHLLAGDGVLHLATQLLHALREPYRIDTLELKTSPSIGISIYPDDGEDLDALIRHADAAMYHAKNSGRNRCQFFTQEIYLHARQTLDLEQQLRHSSPERDFELVYQPFIDLGRKTFVGVEALLRWRHAAASPGAQERFIAAAERIGLIIVLGDWVLQEACRQHEKWRNLGLPPMRIAVNVSAVQFREKNFSERAAGIIRQIAISPSSIEFEVTESAVMSNVEDAAEMLARLKRDGVSIALDDFGTGYSSLSYLSQFPINKLKIDKSFIHNIDTDSRSLAIAETVIALGKKLDMTVVAEGIESQAGIKMLADIGCDLGQGFFISKPVGPDKLVDWYYQAQYKHLFA